LIHQLNQPFVEVEEGPGISLCLASQAVPERFDQIGDAVASVLGQFAADRILLSLFQ
jgi:hypothetical protein